MKKLFTTVLFFVIALQVNAQIPPASFVDGIKTPVILWDVQTTTQLNNKGYTSIDRVIAFDSVLDDWVKWNGTSWKSFGGSSENIGNTSLTIPNGEFRDLIVGDTYFRMTTSDYSSQFYIYNGSIEMFTIPNTQSLTQKIKINRDDIAITGNVTLNGVPLGSSNIEGYLSTGTDLDRVVTIGDPNSLSNGTKMIIDIDEDSIVFENSDTETMKITPDLVEVTGDIMVNGSLLSQPSSNFNLGDEITTDFTVTSAMSGQIIKINSATEVIVTLPDIATLGLTFEESQGFNVTFKNIGTGEYKVEYGGVASGDYVTSSSTAYKRTTIAYLTNTQNVWDFEGNCVPYVFVPPAPTELPNLISKYNSTSIDATASIENDNVTVWNDLVGSNNLTGQATLHVGTNGNNQIRFDGVDNYLTASNNTIFDFIPQTDEFSFVIKLGDIDLATGSPFLNKRTGNTEQYAFAGQSDRVSAYVGNTQTSGFSGTPQGNDVVIVTVSTTTVTVRWNSVELISGNVGTSTSTQNFTLGASLNTSNALYAFVNFDIESLEVYDRVLTPTEITEKETQYGN